MRQEATSQSDLINMGPRQQRPRGKRCTGAEVLEGISVQRAATCSVGRLFQRCEPDSPKLAVPTSSATDILKLPGRGTGASTWDVVCQHSTWHSVLPWTRTTEQHTRGLQSLRHQQKAISSFVPPSSCCIFSLVHKLHQIPLSTFTTWKTFTPILFSAFLSLAFKPTPCHHSPSFLTPLKPQHSCSEAAAFGPHAEFIQFLQIPVA